MKVGYSVTHSIEDVARLKSEGVELMWSSGKSQTPLESFKACLKRHRKNQIIVVNLLAISEEYALIQLFDILQWLKENPMDLIVLEKGAAKKLTHSEYLDLLYELACRERRSYSIRTSKGLEKALKKGTKLGRPSIDELLIKKIIHYTCAEKKNIRDVAALCKVSVGTVHKYSRNYLKEETGQG